MTLQEQYPLSPRKFWKKLLTSGGGRSYGRARSSFFVTLVTLVVMSFYIARLFSTLNTLPGMAANQVASSIPFWITNFTAIMIGGIVALIVVWYIVKAFYVSAYIRKYFYDADDSFVTIRKGVFSPTEIHVQYQKIQDVYVDQDILDRMMGLYDVHLASATITSGIEAHIDGVEKIAAEGLKQFFLQKVKEGGVTVPVTQAAQTPIQDSITPHFAESISSAAYPISGRWVVSQLIGNICLAVFMLLVVWATKAITASDVGGNPVIAMIFFWLPFVLVLLVLWAFVYSLLWKAKFSFDFAEEYIVTQKGIISRQESHTPYRSIQDVLVSQGLLERLFGIATVTIQNAAGGGLGWSSVVIPGQPILKARHLSEVVRQTLLSKSAAKMGV
jgi:membrane protein YdbS with pleckstrin-like domain